MAGMEAMAGPSGSVSVLLLVLVCALGTTARAQDHGQHDAGVAGQEAGAVGSDDWARGLAGAGHCQMILTSGYGYRQFIPLEAAAAPPGADPMAGYPSPVPAASDVLGGPGTTDSPRTSTPANGTSANSTAGRVVLRFQVMAESDAHILLSANRKSDRDAYEVVLGAGNNTYTDFRRLPASIPPRRAFNYSQSVVSGGELRAFWLLADLRTGELAVGPDGGGPILAWWDPEPLRIRYFSLCTWTDVHGTWLYGCNKAGDSPKALDAEWMTPAERVLQHVLASYKKAAPHGGADLDVNLGLLRYTVDDRLGVLTMFCTVILAWRDDRLNWDPANFSGLGRAFVSPSDVWTPRLRVVDPVHLEAQELPGRGPVPDARLSLDSDGHLLFRTTVVLRAPCALLVDSEHGGETYVCTLPMTASAHTHVRHTQLGLHDPTANQRWALILADFSTANTNQSESADSKLGDASTAGLIVVQVQYRGSRISGIFLSAYTAACLCYVLGLLSPAPRPQALQALQAQALPSWSSGARNGRSLLAALNLLMTAVSLLSLQAALPPAVLAAAPQGVTCLSAALLVATVGLLFPMLFPMSSCCLCLCQRGLPPLPRPIPKLLRSPTLAKILLCRSSPPERPRWRECPSGTPTEQVLEMLDAVDAEEARRDWLILGVVVERATCVTGLILTLVAMTPSVLRAS